MAAQKKPTNGVTIRKNAIIKLFLIILISCTGIADAEQTKTIKYLANEPLTLLEMVDISVSFSGGKVSLKGNAPLKGTEINFAE